MTLKRMVETLQILAKVRGVESMDSNAAVELLDQVMRDMSIELIEQENGYFEATDSLTAGSATNSYVLPDYMHTIRKLYEDDLSASPCPINIYGEGGYRSKVGAIRRGKTIYLNFTPSNTVKLTYARVLPALQRGVLTGTPTAIEAKLGTAATSLDDYFNHAYLIMLSGTYIGEISEITDYVASSKACVVAFSGAPAAGDLYEIWCEIPEQYQSAMPELVITKLTVPYADYIKELKLRLEPASRFQTATPVTLDDDPEDNDPGGGW